MHDRGAEAAYEPRSESRVRNQPQEVKVLDHREPGADSEAEDRRIDEEPDAMGVDESDDDERLRQLFGDRRDVA